MYDYTLNVEFEEKSTTGRRGLATICSTYYMIPVISDLVFIPRILALLPRPVYNTQTRLAAIAFPVMMKVVRAAMVILITVVAVKQTLEQPTIKTAAAKVLNFRSRWPLCECVFAIVDESYSTAFMVTRVYKEYKRFPRPRTFIETTRYFLFACLTTFTLPLMFWTTILIVIVVGSPPKTVGHLYICATFTMIVGCYFSCIVPLVINDHRDKRSKLQYQSEEPNDSSTPGSSHNAGRMIAKPKQVEMKVIRNHASSSFSRMASIRTQGSNESMSLETKPQDGKPDGPRNDQDPSQQDNLHLPQESCVGRPIFDVPSIGWVPGDIASRSERQRQDSTHEDATLPKLSLHSMDQQSDGKLAVDFANTQKEGKDQVDPPAKSPIDLGVGMVPRSQVVESKGQAGRASSDLGSKQTMTWPNHRCNTAASRGEVGSGDIENTGGTNVRDSEAFETTFAQEMIRARSAPFTCLPSPALSASKVESQSAKHGKATSDEQLGQRSKTPNSDNRGAVDSRRHKQQSSQSRLVGQPGSARGHHSPQTPACNLSAVRIDVETTTTIDYKSQVAT
ncbi:unnamed protein product [Sympodiomycopsis kandeliae]